MKGTPEKESPPAQRTKYEPVDCPKGGPDAQCAAMNVWGEAWRVWGEEVRAELTRLGSGPPTGVAPPPKPPFK
jgi:hypothetical protein